MSKEDARGIIEYLIGIYKQQMDGAFIVLARQTREEIVLWNDFIKEKQYINDIELII